MSGSKHHLQCCFMSHQVAAALGDVSTVCVSDQALTLRLHQLVTSAACLNTDKTGR